MTAIDEASVLIQKRLSDLKSEETRLERALDALSNGSAPRRSRRSKGKSQKRRGGTRAAQAVKLVVDKPGITAGEIAKQMKIKPNYLYRVMADLEKEKLVKKDGRRYLPA